MRIGPHECVREGQRCTIDLAGLHNGGEVLQIHLVNDAGRGWNNSYAFESVLSPAKELIALSIARELNFCVTLQCIRRSEVIYLYGVIDDQIDRHKGIDACWIAALAGKFGAHGGVIDQRGNTGEILHDHPRRQEGNIGSMVAVGLPGSKGVDIIFGDDPVVDLPQKGFKQDADRERKTIDHGQAGLLECGQLIEADRS